MAKRMFATQIYLAMVMPFAINAQAQPGPISVDGCAKLARVIYSEVAAAAMYGPAKAGPWMIEQGQGDVSVCRHAAKTVSQAFTSAMSSAGYQVNWGASRNDDLEDRGIYCLSAFLSQCYPDRYPLSSIASSADSALVQKSWAVVSQTVMREMYNPISSDEVRFRDNDLKLRLGLSLRSVSVFDERLID